MHVAVAGTDGESVNARSWATAAKAGMKVAAAQQEKARPCTFQWIITNDIAIGKFIPWHSFLLTCVCMCAHFSGAHILGFRSDHIKHLLGL